MSAETWAKALTAMEAGCSVARNTADEWWVCGPMEELDCILGKTAVEAAAAACDALSLPWQEHPVWRMKEAFEVWLPIMWGAKYDEMNHEYNLRVAAETWRKLHWAFLDAAKGGG